MATPEKEITMVDMKPEFQHLPVAHQIADDNSAVVPANDAKTLAAKESVPRIVSIIVNNTCACFAGMSAVMLLLFILCLTSITNQNESFPTTDSSGFQDRADINSLSSAALEVALEMKAEAENPGAAKKEACSGWGPCEVEDDSIITPQTKANQRWSNLMIVSSTAKDNLLSAANLPKALAAVNRLLAQPGQDHFCLMGPAGGMWEQVAKGMSGDATPMAMACSRPLSPLSWLFPSEVESTYLFGAFNAANMADPQVAPLMAKMAAAAAMSGMSGGGGGGGGGWGGRRLSEHERAHEDFRRALNAPDPAAMTAMFAAMAPAAGSERFIEPHVAEAPMFKLIRILTGATLVAGKKTLVFDGAGDTAGGSCTVDVAKMDKNTICDFKTMSCSECNSQWCACDATKAGGGTPDERVEAILSVLHSSGFANFMMDKGFAADNLNSYLMRFQLAYAQPIKADNPYLSETERAAATAAGGFKNGNDKAPCDEDGRGNKRDCQTEAFILWAKEMKPLLDGDNEGCDEAPVSWKDYSSGTVKHTYGTRPATLNCDASTKAYGKLTDENNLGSSVEVLYLWGVISFQEILNVLIHDGMLAVGSISFVVVYLRVHSGSWFLAGMGMFHILMSFPLAFILYRYVYMIEPFYVLSFLSIYIILAIGADDIFVFMDAWRQSAREKHLVDLEQRMAWVWRRAAKAMLITSATTFGAFTATAFSKLNDVSTFGLFTAMLVAANYVFVITYFPCVVLIYHRKYESRPSVYGKTKAPVPCGCCCLGDRKRAPTPEAGGSGPAITAANMKAAAVTEGPPSATSPPIENGKAEERRFMEVVFEDKLAVLVNNPVAHKAMVVVLAIFAICMIFGGAINLGPTTKPDQLLPEWHPFQRIITLFNEAFATGSETPMKRGMLVWGFDPEKPVDTDGIGRYEFEKGKVVWDLDFDLSTPESQEYMVTVCEELADFKVTTGPSVGKTIGGKQKLDYVVRQGAGLGKREVMCPMRSLKEFQLENEKAFPLAKADFFPAVKEWMDWRKNETSREKNPRRWLPHEDIDDALWVEWGDFPETGQGKRPPRVKMAAIEYNTTLGQWDSVYSHLDYAYDTVQLWRDHVVKNAPTGLKKPVIVGVASNGQPSAWVFLNTQNMLVSGAIWGAMFSAIFAFFVLCISTGNPLMALFAITNILAIVGCILGFMYIMGWELGVIESVSCTILVGLSVDYVVHLANSYMEAHGTTRPLRVQEAFAEMGITVFGGAITSLGASGMLFACYFQNFFKFGGFMFMTISLSFVYANFYFMPLLAWVGPEGNFCSYGHAQKSGADVKPV